MFNWIFGIKKSHPAGDQWSVAEGCDGDMPLVFRVREIPDDFNRSGYPHLIAIQWKYQAIGQGMPNPKTLKQMERMEELLLKHIEEPQIGVLTVIVTGNGLRELQWYARSPEAMMAGLNQALGKLPKLPIEISGEEDPEWQAYENFRS